MKDNNKKVYKTPVLTVVTFKTEVGSVISGTENSLGLGLMQGEQYYGDRSLEERANSSSTWAGSDF